jgi:ABC-2 type transport system permease protein
MPLHDASYKHWDGVHLGLWHRRLAITRNGLTGCMQNKMTRHLVVTCWVTALLVSGVMFIVGQLLVADSVVVRYLYNLSPQLQGFVKLLTSWLEKHPEISVPTYQNVLFYYYSVYLMRVSIFALGMAIPLLITSDLASKAIIIYSSKAVSRGDYLLGKFSTAFGLVALTWFGPVCAAWLIGNLLSPDWHFFWHSRAALGHILLFGVVCMTILSLLALGVSALSKQPKTTTAFWFVWWILGGVITEIALKTKPWLCHLSFNYNLEQLALSTFKIGNDIKVAQENIPILGDMLMRINPLTMEALNNPVTTGSLLTVLVLINIAAFTINRKVKPE